MIRSAHSAPQFARPRPRSVFDRAPVDYSAETRKIIDGS